MFTPKPQAVLAIINPLFIQRGYYDEFFYNWNTFVEDIGTTETTRLHSIQVTYDC